MLLGRYYSQISAKGRVALPSKFRRETGNKIIVARWYENCLVIVGLSGFNFLLTRFAEKDEVVTRPIRGVERFILSTAYEIETDGQGRFVVPPMLREMANLKDKIVFVGLGERIELWNQAVWESEEATVKDEADKMLLSIAKGRVKK